MGKKILSLVFVLAGWQAVLAQDQLVQEDLWAREFVPASNQVVQFQGYGDDGQLMAFTTIYHIKSNASREASYLISEYNIFPEDAKEASFRPSVSVDYYFNENGLWAQTPFEKSQGIPPCLVLPYQFTQGSTFVGCNDLEYIILDTDKTVEVHGLTYKNCVEVITSQGDYLYYMPETGVVLGLGNDEKWMTRKQTLSDAELARQYNLR